ncbi:hypothetical protein OCOL_001159 [Ordospora colligata]|uniref:Uncharacterized protein n=1 Tax=Ordospora colligata OC4 TaxID=1354746 RepID=A0A0B2UIN6_9MICR|nr:uncharacterized protein M896_120440 [Ordospora colligata OC4]KHN68825.1 hypothetical protein M896_120440 [Ordospora colligata OC4]
MILLLFALIAADNIEIKRSEFDVLELGNQTVVSSGNESGAEWNWVKISFSGEHRYVLNEYKPRKFRLIDVTEYIDEVEQMVFRIDLEKKYYAMIPSAWVMVLTIIVVTGCIFLMPMKRTWYDKKF